MSYSSATEAYTRKRRQSSRVTFMTGYQVGTFDSEKELSNASSLLNAQTLHQAYIRLVTDSERLPALRRLEFIRQSEVLMRVRTYCLLATPKWERSYHGR